MASLLNMSGGSLLNKGLPYDAQIEYLQSSGTQYIDTGIKLYSSGTGSYQIDMKFYMFSSGNANFASVLNTMYEVSPYPGMVIRNQNGNVTQIGDGAIGIGSTDTIITYSKTTTKGGTSFNTNTTLFASYNGSNNPWRYCTMRLYNCKITSGGTILRDFIPVRVGQVGYLYDKVSGTLFGNAGTGAFILGQDKTN